MPANHTAKDIVQMAMDMELLGQTFYESLAMGCNDRQVAALCARLAKAEQTHHASFKRLLDAMLRPGVDVPMTQEQRADAARLVGANVLPDRNTVHKVGMGGNLPEAMAMAIQMEKDAIAFYQSMLPLVPDGQSAVSRIIQEEQTHLRDLQATEVR